MATHVTKIQTQNGESVDYPAKLVTITQWEETHTGFHKRTRGMLVHAALGDPDFAWLQDAVVRIGRSVYIDETRALRNLDAHRGRPPSLPRNPHGRRGKSAQ